MTTEEIETSEKLRDGGTSKSAIRILMRIFDKYNGTNHNRECWCSGEARKTAHIKYFNWYDSNRN